MRRAWLCIAVVAVAACAQPPPAPTGPAPTRRAAAPTTPTPTPGSADTVRTVHYGGHPDQVADLRIPPGSGRLPVVVLLHGGFWLERYRRDLMAPHARDLADAGFAVWNVEYRRVGGDGGWPATLVDAAAALDHLAALDHPRLDLGRVIVAGHSAGGHLALWSATRDRLAAGEPGADPRVRPCAVIGQAAVTDLRHAAAERLGGGATRGLLGGGPDEVPDRYAVADPAARLPLGVPVLLVHGSDDRIVPPAMSRGFTDRARAAGDEITLRVVEGGHFDHLDVDHAAWVAVRDWLADPPDPCTG